MASRMPGPSKIPFVLERLEEFIELHRLLLPGSTVIVGYSGGADSACLLHLLVRAGYDVTAAHLHHGMRPEADTEAEQCREVAQSLGISFLMGRADVPSLSVAKKVSLEEAGRMARYGFFDRCSSASGGAMVATAHTLNDHVETMLINLARGTGVAGLAGIPVQRDNIIRPLRWARREETREFCIANSIWFHDDPANVDTANVRTEIRLRAVPAIQAVNSRALENAERLSWILSSENELLNSMAAAMLEACERRGEHPLNFLTRASLIELDAARLRHYPIPLQRRGLRLAVSALGADLEYGHVETCVNAISSCEKVSVTAEGGQVVVEADPDTIRLRDITVVEPFRELLTIPGEVIADGMNWSLAAWSVSGDFLPSGPLEGVLDVGRAKGPLFTRPFQPGDRMELAGHSPKKLQDLLTDAKVVSEMKKRLPIVCDMLGPVWAPMLGTDRRVDVVEPNASLLALRLSPASTD